MKRWKRRLKPEEAFNPQDLPIKLAIVSRPNVKSTLTNHASWARKRVVVA